MSASDWSTRTADRAHIADIENQIAKLELSIKDLQSEKALTEKRLDAYKYPVLTLPNEVVSKIFIHFLPVYPLCSPQTGRLSPTILTHICRRWREIALATPALWRAISLRYEGATGKKQVHILETWLGRSGCYPLSVHMEDHDMIPHGECIEAIAPHRTRLEYAKLEMSLSSLRVIEGSMPLLRQLSIRLPWDDIPPLYIAFRDVPRLRAASLWDSTYTSTFLPWSQLTSLTLVAKTPSECTPILRKTINLVYCKLVLTEEAHVRQPDIQLPYLESLVFVQFTQEDVPATHYLETFIVPALSRLQIPESFLVSDHIHNMWFGSRANALSVFISKSGCTLRDVLITGGRRSLKKTFRNSFPSINFSFNAVLTGMYCDDEPDADVKPFSEGCWYP
ncbi:hypothetical protein B0H11DRAFT_1116536 [Mycena galericulata]|nr:hypothetical protein B0H11DRAFT_1116536 [Mycena galericulata]